MFNDCEPNRKVQSNPKTHFYENRKSTGHKETEWHCTETDWSSCFFIRCILSFEWYKRQLTTDDSVADGHPFIYPIGSGGWTAAAA